MAKRYVCQTMAPSELTGNLGPLYCNREVGRTGHIGDHRAHKTIERVGKINVTWKQNKHKKSDPPPVIELPPLSTSYLEGWREQASHKE